MRIYDAYAGIVSIILISLFLLVPFVVQAQDDTHPRQYAAGDFPIKVSAKPADIWAQHL